MTTAVVISRKTLADAAYARLRTEVANASGYVGEAGTVPPYDGNPGSSGPVPTLDGDGHVAPYWILHTTGGAQGPELDLADTITDLDWFIQITVAAGYVGDLQALVSRIDAAMFRWSPVIDGLTAGRFKPPAGYQPPELLDRDVTPHRPFMPLQYAARFTRI